MSKVLTKISYDKLKEEALSKLKYLKEKAVVCIGAATCGKAAGAMKIKEAFQKEIEKKWPGR
jgi:NADH-quinone oxidoreductase subunit F